ncbi:MAG: trypsin-like peptidase domain-containing protein, partial [Polyangiaceae bacterium]|nr:trypsin-like peptidase domain-containing protein [Polyangiaceae bacterium]
MHVSRVAMVYSEPDVGSGYLVTPSLVLTARHVVSGRSRVEICRCGSPEYHAASVAWSSDDQLDACVLRLASPLDLGASPAPSAGRFGRSQSVDWECTGFARAGRIERDDACLRETVGGFGVITVGGGAVRGLLELAAESWPRTHEGWRGLSGAAVFAQRRLVGVIRDLPPQFDGRRLDATPVESILEQCLGDCPALATELGGFGHADLPVVPTVGLATRVYVPETRYDRRPAALLLPDRRVVPFQEVVRETELEAIESWCASDTSLGIRLFCGPGGAGKTRLFIEQCRRQRRLGWHAGFLNEQSDAERLLEDIARSGQPALMVVDYAEARADLHRLLASVCRAALELPGVGLRLALLSRHSGSWWQNLIEQSDEALRCALERHEPLELRPVAVTPGRRREVFEHARTHLARALPQAADLPAAGPMLEEEVFSRVLYLHLAALASLLGQPLAADRLLDEACVHEEHFWRDAARGLARWDAREFPVWARRLVSAITLRNGATEREAELLRQRLAPELDAGFLRLLCDLWPGRAQAGRVDEWVAPMEPDLLGEAMVLRCLTRSGDAALAAALDGAGDAQLQHTFVVLGRIVESRRDDRELMGRMSTWLEAAFSGDVEQRARAACQALVSMPELPALAGAARFAPALAMCLLRAFKSVDTLVLAEAVEQSLPEHSVVLAEIALWAAQRRLHASGELDSAAKAALIGTIGNRLSELGRPEEALGATQEAVDQYRTLARARPDAFLPDLATSLNNLG